MTYVRLRHGKAVSWNYEDVAQVLDESKTLKELAPILKRTPGAISLIRLKAKRFKEGEDYKYNRGPLLEHFKRYYKNEGGGKFSSMAKPEVQVADIEEIPDVQSEKSEIRTVARQPETTEVQVKVNPIVRELAQEAEETFDKLKGILLAIGEARADEVIASHNASEHITREAREAASQLAHKNVQLTKANDELWNLNQELEEFRRIALESQKKNPGFASSIVNRFKT